jgi:hypothetical protein
MVGIASGINEVSRDCNDLKNTKPVAFTKIEIHLPWIEEVKKYYEIRKKKPTRVENAAETKHLTHLALISAFCIILMI